MRWRFSFVAMAIIITQAQAETAMPWFGSEASIPTQISLTDSESQFVDSNDISTTDLASLCPIETCPQGAKLVKQPK